MNYFKKTLIFTLGLFLIFQSSYADEIRVSLEPLPPLIIDAKNGLTIELLKEVEKISDLKFKIVIMPYHRAKLDLKNGKSALMGHTPHKQESKEFYNYGHELKWSIPTKIDVYSAKLKNVDLNNFKSLKKIGTPRGNKEFLSDLLKIPLNQFYEGKLDNLLRMLKANRIDAFLFERASSQTTIRKLNLKGIYYTEVMDVAASLAVQKNLYGLRLKKKLDALILKANHKKIFKKYLKSMSLSKHGVVSVSK
ncbi:MAG: transporter substrate-binding domain-containing protein [Desulfobacterales bacterium]|nr:transporter substrate-binding domain-containing protein [Desulfobacterales bacterium]